MRFERHLWCEERKKEKGERQVGRGFDFLGCLVLSCIDAEKSMWVSLVPAFRYFAAEQTAPLVQLLFMKFNSVQ